MSVCSTAIIQPTPLLTVCGSTANYYFSNSPDGAILCQGSTPTGSSTTAANVSSSNPLSYYVSSGTNATYYLKTGHTDCSGTILDYKTLTVHPLPAAPAIINNLCPAPGNSANLSWSAPVGAISYNLQFDGISSTLSTNTCSCSSSSCTCIPSAIIRPGNTYNWSVSACNGNNNCSAATVAAPLYCVPSACPGGWGACGDSPYNSANMDRSCTSGWASTPGIAGTYDAWCRSFGNLTRGFCYQCGISPWIQATGDVHSNTRINASGGP